MKNKRILVTGGTGAVGGALRDIASAKYPDREFLFPTRAECDLLDADATRAYVAQTKPDAILHFAAAVGGVGFNKEHPATLLRENVLMSIAVLDAGRTGGVGKTVMLLSSGMYPKDAPLPLSEDAIHDGYPSDSNYGYAFAKRLIDPLIRSYREEYGTNVIGLSPSNIVGEHSSFRETDSLVIPALIRRFYEKRDTNEPLVVWGDGTALREVSYASDIARMSMWALDSYDEAPVLNIGTSEEASIRDIAEWVADAVDVDASRLVFDPEKPGGPARKSTDTTRAASLISFSYTPIRETIKRVAAHFIAHYSDGSLKL